MNFKIKLCSDPKHFAWVTWTLLANNPITPSTYLLFCVADLVIIMFYSFILVQRIHFQNFDYTPISSDVQNTTELMFNNKTLATVQNNNESYFQGNGIKLVFLQSIDQSLNTLVQENSEMLFFATIAVLGASVFILMVLLIMALVINSHADLEQPSLLKRAFSFILVALLTFLHMPLLDVVIRTIVAAHSQTDLAMGILVLRYGVCSLTALIFGVLMIYLVRIFNVCVPSELIPWCSPISKIVFLNLLIKALLVIFNAFDISGQLALVEVLFLFILQGFQASYRVLFAPNYIRHIDIFVKTKDFSVCLIFFIGIICKVVGDRSNYDLVYFMLFIPIITVGWLLFEVHRKQTILQKIKRKQLKMEVENEFALYLMMTLVRDSTTSDTSSQKVFGQLMDLMLTHIEDCDDQLCICDEMENFYELLRLRQLHNQEVFPLLRKERKRYKKIIDDQGLIGTISNITDITMKITSSSESTHSKSEIDSLNDRHGIENDYEEPQASSNLFEEKDKQTEKTKEIKQEFKKKSTAQIYKINIDETKHRFLSELLYLFYFEMIKKYPDSFKIQLLSNYFALLYKKKEMLCIFQMRSFNKSRLSKMDQCCHLINEQYLLYEITKIQKQSMHQMQNQLDGNFNGDYFIQMNSLYKQLNFNIEILSSGVSSFWKVFQKPQIDVISAYGIGTRISQSIQEVFKIFELLDTLKITKDYQMYFQFAIVQLHILNDPVAYELYIGKMKSILEINKVYQKNFTQSGSNNTDQSNFIIVDANGSSFGQIIQCNNSFRLMLGWNEEDIKRNRIESFMPDLIREKHGEFMNRYNKTGQSFIINNKVTMFVKKPNGYVIPVELYIKFHYSIDYQYTFLAILKPFYEMAPFTNGVKYNTNQLLYLIVDLEEGRITEYSESCKKLLGSYGFKTEIEQNGIIKRITDVMIDFDYHKMKTKREERYQRNEVYEGNHKLDLNQFDDGNAMSHEHNKKVGNLVHSLLLNNGGIVTARSRIFEERYSGGVLDLNIFCFAILNEGDTGGSIVKNESSGRPESRNLGSVNVRERKDDIGELHKEDGISISDQNESQSITGSSTSSMKDSTTSMAEFRNFHSFTEQTTPKTLTLIIRLILALYFVMIIVASANLGVNVTRQMQSEADVHTVRQAFDRINWVSMNQLLVRVLLNIANGYEPENSILVADRFQQYIHLQEERVQQLKNTQSTLQRNNFLSSDEFINFREGKNVPLYYLSESNEIYTKYETLNVAYNLYIAKLTEMNSFTKNEMIGNLSIQTLNAEKGTNYKPSYLEQSIFFVVQNGNKELRQFSIDATAFYGRESETHAEQNITSTKVTAIISIVIIIAISFVIAPILTKAEIRKYKALLYFLKIPRDKFPDLIKNCEYCLNMNDEARYYQILKDYESFLGIKLVNQQVEQLRQAKDEQLNIDNQLSKSGSNSGGPKSSDILSTANIESSAHQKQGAASSIAQDDCGDPQFSNYEGDTQSKIGSGSRVISKRRHESLDLGDHNFNQAMNSQIFEDSSMNLQGTKLIVKKGTALNKPLEQVQEGQREMEEESDEMMDHNNEKDLDQEIDQKLENQNNNKFTLNTLNMKQKGNSPDSKKHIKDEEEKTVEEIEDDKREADEIVSKTKLINAQAYKRRSVMVFSSLSIILVLSTYFIIAYFLAMKTFQTASEVIVQLEGIFYKGTCFDSAMNFLRESEIRNKSMAIKSTIQGYDSGNNNTLEATQYYLDFCFEKEEQYKQMRRSFPKYFDKAADYINAMESSGMCDHIYTGEFEYLREKCKISLDGILNKGLTNAFYYMFTQILKANMNFNNMGETSNRNQTELRKMLLDEQMVQIIDMKAIVLDPSLNQLKSQCMSSVIEYIQLLLNNFITAFIVFIVLLSGATLCLIFIGFRILRQSMWETNIILKIIPFETLPKSDRIEIKDFFKS